jgi:hypothetical protein
MNGLSNWFGIDIPIKIYHPDEMSKVFLRFWLLCVKDLLNFLWLGLDSFPSDKKSEASD